MLRHIPPPKLGRPSSPQPLCHRLPLEIHHDNTGHCVCPCRRLLQCAHRRDNTRKMCCRTSPTLSRCISCLQLGT